MIAYIKGKISFKTPTEIHVETAGGVAYLINISLLTYSQLEKLDEIKIFTQLIVKEDSHTLYGFMTEQEKNLFNKLMSVSGIGPNTSRVILSSMTPDEIVSAIATDDHMRFSKVKGIGPKTAKRVILDLKDKMTKEIASGDINMISIDNSARDEALSALTTLGFPKNTVEKALSVILKNSADSMDSEALIKAVLKKMS